MKKLIALTCIIFSLITMSSWRSNKPGISTSRKVRTFILSELKEIQNNLVNSRQNLNNIEQLKSLYDRSRRHYKRCEFFIEFYSPREAKYNINGPLTAKHDPEFGNQVFYPHGFQRIEELLFGDSDKLDTASLSKEYSLLMKQFDDLLNYYKEIDIDDGKILEMYQLELVRIAALNLSGYDATMVQNNVMEAAWSIQGIEETLKAFESYTKKNIAAKAAILHLTKSLSAAKNYLQLHTDYNTFDRLKFITSYINDLNKNMIAFHDACQLPWDKRKQALNLQQPFLFSWQAFNKQYFSMYYEDSLRLEQQAFLGKKLFSEPMLSGNKQTSCASCHNPDLAFTDGRLKSNIIDTLQIARNTPTLLNVIFQRAFFYDGRAYQLEQQVFDVVHNQNEMNSSLNDAALKLREHPTYQTLFKQAFKGTADSAITPYAIQKAITEYEKTLISFNSRFDDYLNGNLKALTKNEINGYNLFAGKALCGSCHFLPLFNGTVPPFYNDSEFEVIGTPKSSDNKLLDPDPGRFDETNVAEQKFAFKTPTIRNVELTAPYMHNGAYASLEKVVDFYSKGGGVGLGFTLPNQTLPFDSLKLSATEREDIMHFMKSLTDRSYAKKKLKVHQN